MNTVDVMGTVTAINKQPKFCEIELKLPKEKKDGSFEETKVKFVGQDAKAWAEAVQVGNVIVVNDVNIAGFRGEKGLYVGLTSFRPGQWIWTGREK